MSQLLLISMCLAFVMIFSATALPQTRWKLAAVDTGGKSFYIDENLSQQPNGNILGWERSNLPANAIYPAGSYFIARYEWNCGNKTHRQLQFFIYDRSGEFIERLDTDTNWKDNPPDSIGEIILNDVCSVLKKKRDKSPRPSPSASSFAQITVRKANLRSAANSGSEIIREVALGEKMVLVGEEPVGVWYQVLDPETNSQGWLNGNNFKIVKANKSVKRSKKTKK